MRRDAVPDRSFHLGLWLLKKYAQTGFRPVGNLVVLSANNNNELIGNNGTMSRTLSVDSDRPFGLSQNKRLKCRKKCNTLQPKDFANFSRDAKRELETVPLNSSFDTVDTWN